ncbi:uncharacterized protein LOC129741107 isoform X2 [Uranotaenia lowii]|uniref:uncharacterized protein LOC129741107 isoform X2 n=1 Tax=Uranotaenia lowii TaxID=190385 RepID=UPI002478C101|nr:uncharacterized protein LOC129741107 isoform X2 [Uranotaenia lowii]
MDPSQPSQFTVQAQYSFKGTNNDELCFKKGDIITLTQREDGGWWEGTLGSKTGWFPSNYVKEYVGPLPVSEVLRPPEEIQAFRSVVFRDLIESEKAHVAEIRGMVENFLEPLEGSQILTGDEYTQLMCNFVEVVEMHEEFLQNLEESNDRVGKVFLTKAPTMKRIHQCYCSAHPRAIVIVDKYRDDLNTFMEKQGAAKPGLLVLTTGLSKPFRRLDKYSAILQELERHMESGHPDRGDTQRSIAVFKDIASSCSATRRQKELELQILTGPIRGWQGQELSSLGEIIHMGSVAVGSEHKDRYFVLFSETLLILSVSQRMSAFKYEGKLPLTGINVNRLEDTDQIKNAFEITGPLIDRIVAVCQGPTEASKWVDFLNAKVNPTGVENQQPVKDMKRIVSSSAVNIPQPPPHNKNLLDTRGYSTRISYCAYSQNYRPTLPNQSYPPTAPYAALTSFFRHLFKTQGLSRYVVQALLYPQITQDVDTSEVVLRRKHRTTVRMYRRDREAEIQKVDRNHNVEEQEEDSDDGSCTSSCSGRSNNLERQNAVDYGDDDPYETITFFTGRKTQSTTRESTVYESYIEQNAQVEADDTFFFVSGNANSEERKSLESEGSHIIGSRAIPCLKLNDRESFGSLGRSGANGNSPTAPIHTTTAKLLLGEIKQQCSEQSQVSSFEHRVAHGRMACEDLVNLDDSMKIKHSLQQKPIIEERHSMPTLFVGNRFANSSVTEIYIPSWKDRLDVQQPTQQQSVEVPLAPERTSIHSSSLDIPASETTLSVPDQVAAELLYNFHSQHLSETSFGEILTPPADFDATSGSCSIGCLSRELTPFRKHSINSDKKLLLNQNHLRKGMDEERARSSPGARRCVSYQFVNIVEASAGEPGVRNTAEELLEPKCKQPQQTSNHNRHHTKCRFCSASIDSHCDSPRSSDSDLQSKGKASEAPTYSSSSNCRENQTRTESSNSCTVEDSSRLRHSRSSHNIGRFVLLTRDSEFDFTDSGQFDHSQEDHNHLRNNTRRNEDSEGQKKRIRSRSEEPQSSGDEEDSSGSSSVRKQVSGRSKIVINLCEYRRTFEPDKFDGQTDAERGGTIFKTGLYAHWWKKEKLPIFVMSNSSKAKESRQHVPRGNSNPSSLRLAVDATTTTPTTTTTSSSGHFSDAAGGSDVSSNVDDRQQSPVAGQFNRTAHVATQTQSIVQSPPKLQSGSAATATATVPETRQFCQQQPQPVLRTQQQQQPIATGAKPKIHQRKS